MNKIVFTGGHHNSALLIAQKLKDEGFEIFWLGHKFSSKGDANFSQEYKDVTNANIKFVELHTPKIHKGNILAYLKLFKSTIFCLKLFSKIKPNLIISFGGYLSVPAVLAASILKIPSVGHEQTQTLGKANKFNLNFYQKLFLTWPIEKIIDNPKVQVVGLPIKIDNSTIKIFNNDKPIILVSGGKQGSHIINSTLEKILPDLLKDWNVYHQTGHNSATKDFEKFTTIKKSLPPNLTSSYKVIDYTYDFKKILNSCDLIIGRSGAHTVYEILLSKKLMIAIPLPFSFANEQFKNAKVLEEIGLGYILEQIDLKPENLIKAINNFSQTKIDCKKVDDFISKIPLNADKILIREIKEILKEKP